jgi:crotonobetainyl-CoA:carnitine CoA-transferase CaiB-like acyl-CoA transferase
MSGFAAINGEPDGAPLLPPIALTDEVTGLAAAFATMVALHSGVGQVVDVNLLESLFQLMGPLMSLWELQRPGCSRGSVRASPTRCPGAPTAAPTAAWVAISTSAESVAQCGCSSSWAWAATRASRASPVGSSTATRWTPPWPPGARPGRWPTVLAEFEAAQAAAAPVYTMAELAEDPHARARGMVVDVGGTPMQGLIAGLSATPGRLRWAGRPLGADTEAVLAELVQLDELDEVVTGTGTDRWVVVVSPSWPYRVGAPATHGPVVQQPGCRHRRRGRAGARRSDRLPPWEARLTNGVDGGGSDLGADGTGQAVVTWTGT